jgi:hypothetical protein
MNRVRSALLFIGSPKVTVAGLLWLAVLVVWGTVFQAGSGLYQAQIRIFQSWFFLAGGLMPLPGVLAAGALLFINLLAALLFRLRYRWSQVGLILIHYGLLLLLGGGFLTLRLSQESVLTLAEGESSNLSSAAHDWELAVSIPQNDGKKVVAVDANRLRSGRLLRLEPFGIELVTERYLANSVLSENEENGYPLLRERPVSPEPSENIPGGKFLVRFDRSQQREILLFGGDVSPKTVEAGGISYFFSLRLKRFPLPATIKLLDFRKILYPGSDIARSYESRVEVEQGSIRREAIISMNKPLRLREYTFYQSSYSQRPGESESSTLAVVRNSGRLLPYLATTLISVGLVFHFLFMLVSRSREESKTGA